MRIVILADIHGNLQAFEAALADAQRQGYDQLVIAGDVVNGPDTRACWQLARSLGCPIVRGNHERYVAHFGTGAASPAWSTPQYAPVQWSVTQHSEAERAEIEQLPTELRLPGIDDLLIVHASQRSDNDSLRTHTSDAELAVMFPRPEARLIVRAHNHVGAMRQWGERIIITASSVGLPLNADTTAQYTVLDQSKAGWRISHRSVSYDLAAALERYHSSGYIAASGPIGRLFYRELATASFQIVPFLKAHARWSSVEPISLEDALERFLSA